MNCYHVSHSEKYWILGSFQVGKEEVDSNKHVLFSQYSSLYIVYIYMTKCEFFREAILSNR